MSINDIVMTVVGIVVGLLTGYYFENRYTREARSQNEDLRRQVRELGELLLSLGAGHLNASHRSTPPAAVDQDRANEILQWARRVQDPSGHVVLSRLIEHFLQHGATRSQVEEALDRLVTAGLVRVKERTVEIT
jgi:hypothetical protein